MPFNILYLGPESHFPLIQKVIGSHHVDFSNDEASADHYIGKADVILDAYMKIPFPEKRLCKAENLKLFITATTGASHVDHVYLERKKIPLLTLKGQEHITRNITAAAEHSWLLLLAVARQLPAAIKEPLSGGWDRNKFPGVMLRGKTIGIIGCGRIGEWMARYAKATGLNVLGYDPYHAPDPELFNNSELEILLSESDFITLHIPLNDSTRNFIGSAEIMKMKKGAILINTSRGEIMDESALLEALKIGKIRGAGLDVIRSEPYIAEDPLVLYAKEHDNLIITPHIGGFSPDALDIVLTFTCNRILDFFHERN